MCGGSGTAGHRDGPGPRSHFPAVTSGDRERSLLGETILLPPAGPAPPPVYAAPPPSSFGAPPPSCSQKSFGSSGTDKDVDDLKDQAAKFKTRLDNIDKRVDDVVELVKEHDKVLKEHDDYIKEAKKK